MTPNRTLIVGIGSPYGDDQVGWRVVEAFSLMDRNLDDVVLHAARSPSELLDRLDGVTRLVAVDACRGGDPVGTVRRWTWPSTALEQIDWSGTHDLGLCAVLSLAERLGRLPAEVELWSVEANETRALPALSPEVVAAVENVARRISERCEIAPPGKGEPRHA